MFEHSLLKHIYFIYSSFFRCCTGELGSIQLALVVVPVLNGFAFLEHRQLFPFAPVGV